MRATRHHHHHPHLPAPWAGLDGRVAAGIALGAAGLFMFNIVCGPFAIGLGIAGYRHPAGRFGRTAAIASILLGTADLVVLAVLAASTFRNGSLVWPTNP